MSLSIADLSGMLRQLRPNLSRNTGTHSLLSHHITKMCGARCWHYLECLLDVFAVSMHGLDSLVLAYKLKLDVHHLKLFHMFFEQGHPALKICVCINKCVYS